MIDWKKVRNRHISKTVVWAMVTVVLLVLLITSSFLCARFIGFPLIYVWFVLGGTSFVLTFFSLVDHLWQFREISVAQYDNLRKKLSESVAEGQDKLKHEIQGLIHRQNTILGFQ
jgi:uncharacterized membrane protein